ncbi:MAG: peptidoglycan-binding protein [Candidatus Pacebacteria bacterium]|nr:peptidoglycan-binding protein [Candidatus Paceibacterota bacterium]
MWMFPKDERNNSGSVWYSSDGATWTKATSGQKWKIQNAVVIPGDVNPVPAVQQESTQSTTLPVLVLSKNLQFGQTNGDVLTLQTYLVSQAYLDAVPNGRYGPLTRQAVQKLQADLGIEFDGSSVGPKTRALLSNPSQKIISSETSGSGVATLAKLSAPCTNPSIHISRTQDAARSQSPITAGVNTLVSATYVVTAGGTNCLIRLTNIKYEVTGDPSPISVSPGPDWPLRFPWLYSMPMKKGNDSTVFGTASTFFARVTPSGSGSAYIAPVQIDAVTQEGIPVTAVNGLNVKSKALIVAE